MTGLDESKKINDALFVCQLQFGLSTPQTLERFSTEKLRELEGYTWNCDICVTS
jgi:hypothetical protein